MFHLKSLPQEGLLVPGDAVTLQNIINLFSFPASLSSLRDSAFSSKHWLVYFLSTEYKPLEGQVLIGFIGRYVPCV